MNHFEQIQNDFYHFLQKEFHLSESKVTSANFELNVDEEKQAFGDINSNAAMVFAKQLKQNPRAIAQTIVEKFTHPSVQKIEVAGPGFLNFFLQPTWYKKLALEIQQNSAQFFSEGYENKTKINIEFVSANPTGPMHVGHGRNGILGDVLGNLLSFLQQDVTKEFYINDAGSQISKLGNSFKIRCLQQLGETVELPEDAYHGEYLVDFAKECVQEFGKDLAKKDDLFFADYAKNHMRDRLEETLASYGIHFDVWFSEKSLHDKNKVTEALEKLQATGHTYESEGALWFRSTTFGDDKDRVLRKANGEMTYVAADIAYLINKFERGFTKLFMVLGHDHHSYKIRLHAIMQALGYNPNDLVIILYQLVHIIQDGKPVRMSKRTGTMITLKDIIEEVGTNVARFFFLNRKADAELEFDIDLALQQSNENPVYYIQYAYVRSLSMHRKAEEAGINLDQSSDFTLSFTPLEQLILKKICSLKQLLHNISNNYQIHLIAYYSYELAHLFHKYYNKTRVIDTEQPKQTAQRLHLVSLVKNTLDTTFKLMGITPLQKM